MLKGYAFIILGASCWALIGIFSSIAFNQGIQPMEVAFWRAVIAWLLFGTQAIIQKDVQVDRKDIPLLAGFGLFGISLFYVSYLVAVKEGGVAFASVLLYTAPGWVVVCSFFLYGEKMSVGKIVAVLLVVMGVLLISKTGGNSNSLKDLGWLAVCSGLASGFCYSLYYTVGKYFSGKYSLTVLFLYVLPVGALGIFPFVTFNHKTVVAWMALISVAFISTYIANYFYYRGLKYLEAGRASIVATIEPVIAALCGYLVFGEYFTMLGYVGVGLILSAVLITIYQP